MDSMVKLTINDRSLEVQEGTTVLEAARQLGVKIPTLCYYEAIKPYGGCRLCLVEVAGEGRTRLIASCTHQVAEGLRVVTDSEEVLEARRFILDLLWSRCPDAPVLRDLAQLLGLREPSFSKGESDCILCGKCTRVCAELQGVGAIVMVGRGARRQVTTPFGEVSQVCRTCGACAFICPTGHIKDIPSISGKTPRPLLSKFDAGLRSRAAIYRLYPQAVPNTPVIDKDHCVHFLTGECGACASLCPTGAIHYDQQNERMTQDVGAIILAPGFRPFNPGHYLPYHYAAFSNVVTSLEFERILSAAGPFGGHLIRPSDHQEPRKIAWLQCVGSRDLHPYDHSYCSAVCCMYAIKQTLIAREHSHEPLDTAIFFMDMRTSGKDFDKYCQRARDQGVRFIRSRVHSLDQVPDTGNLLLRYITEDGRIVTETFDLVVLSVGMETAPEVVELSRRLGVEVNAHHFARTSPFAPVSTNQPGIFVCGAFQGPKDIPQSVTEAMAVAAAAGELLAAARHHLAVQKPEYPERDVTAEEPRIGVFICHCGTNIAGVIDVAALKEYAATLPGVLHAETNLFTCSQDTQKNIQDRIAEHNLNRIVVASCSPRTHEAVFQETLREGSLNPYLLEMANIRDQDAWVHQQEPEAALDKAKDLVRMAAARVATLEPLQREKFPVTKSALVVGGGVAGMETALSLANMMFPVHLVEKTDRLGGNAWNLVISHREFDYRGYLEKLIKSVESHEKIEVMFNSGVKGAGGFIGNFQTIISTANGDRQVEHGVTILATGGRAYIPTEYAYGQHADIFLSADLDEAIATRNPRVVQAGQAVFIQCVGSREPERPYCSRVCCTRSVESALVLKELNPAMDVFILYRDMRTYGELEDLYQKAREEGIMFIRFDQEHKPRVEITPEGGLEVLVRDPILERLLKLKPDIINLASAILPNPVQDLAELFKVPLNAEGFFHEVHAKLRPVDFSTDGIYLAGLAHYPKPLDECIVQGKAAAARAATVLAREMVEVQPLVARVNQDLCIGCGFCELACPFGAMHLVKIPGKGYRSENLPAYCKGCGVCAAGCPMRAIDMLHFRDRQILAAIHAGGHG
jgi:heterodisulfide reductase subunit A